MKIILASKSPRRKELMELAGFEFEVLVSECEEIWNEELSIEENSKEIAYEKAKTVFNNTQGDRTIIGSDTVVVKDGKIYGKPNSREEAIKMIRTLQGGVHTVYTSLAILIENKGYYKEYKEIVKSNVYVKSMEDTEIINYVDNYDVYDKAGAYAIQSRFSVYIKKIDGDYFSIIGLPINKIYDIFKENEIW